MTQKILTKCYENYLRTSKNYYSDTWKATSSQNIEFFKEKNLDNMLTNNNIRGLAPIDNYPSYDYLNKKTSKELNQLQKKEYFEIYKKNKYLNYTFGSSYTIAFRYFLNIKDLITKSSNVLIIGDGLGILSSMILKKINCKVFLCDLPETLVYQEYFLRNNLKNKKFQYIANHKDQIISDNQITFINADQLDRLNIKLDLAINTDSFGEMDKISVNNYFSFASRSLVKGGFFYYCNPIGLSGESYSNPGDYPLDHSFKISNLEVLYPSHRDTFCKYLGVTAEKKTISKKEIYKDIKNKQSIISKFYFDSEKITSKSESKKNTKITINLANKISSGHHLSNKDKIIFKNLFKEKKIKKNKLNLNIFYHHIFLKFMQYFKHNNKDKAKDSFKLIQNLKNKEKENTSLVKIASLLRFIDKEWCQSLLKKIPENFLEIIYLKFFLYEGINHTKQEILFKKMLKFKRSHFFDDLKVFYCANKVNDKKAQILLLKILQKKVTNKDNAINFLKLLFLMGNFQSFFRFYKLYKSTYKINQKNLESIILSANFLNKNTNLNFKNFFSSNFNIKYNQNSSLDQLIICFKLGLISEKNFMKIILKNYKDYYSIGFILKNTLNYLSKKNTIVLSEKSLKIRSTPQNINFICEIYFYNSLYKNVLNTLKLIKKIESYSVFYALKKYLSKSALISISKKKQINALSSLDFFKMIHNGRVVILPFLCTGNNAVQFNNN